VQGRDVLPIVRAELEKVKGERDLLKLFLAKAMHVSPLLQLPSLLLRLVRWCVSIVQLLYNYCGLIFVYCSLPDNYSPMFV
jgi:hypothetical protein